MVIWPDEAKTDLKNIYEYIVSDSKFYAQKVREKFVQKSKTLDSTMEQHPIEPELNDKDFLFVLVYSYKMLYKIVDYDKRIVLIIGIISFRQSIRKKFPKLNR